MRLQDLLIKENNDSTDAFFAAVRKVPADKLDWKPGEDSRSALGIAREVALSPTWPDGLMTPGAKLEMTPEMMEEFGKRAEALTTLDDCESTARAGVAALNEKIAGIPDDHLFQTAHLPFGKNPDWPIYDVAGIHAWNARYHTGQVNYIQTLYGDKSME
ncbi:MAG: hypothetical protein ABUL72_00345 [Armatimonadota bacterium]